MSDGADRRGGRTIGSETIGLRLDKWLWFARFFKSRTLASEICAGGKVRIDGTVATKAHAQVRPGQVLTFVQGRYVRVIKVLALANRRGPAAEAQALYEDLAPPEPNSALPNDPLNPPSPSRARGSGRPSKKDRREIDRWKNDR